jgi:chemosensory pili system protein ChpA (sensor histidine kinase/response regulator)
MDVDLGPLTWVKPEIDQALARGLEALGSFYSNPDDQGALRLAQSHLHQVTGALQIVGLEGVIQFAEEIERHVDRLATLAMGDIGPTVAAIDAAARALGTYLEDLVGGIPAVPLRLFKDYAALQKLRGVGASSPTDLFFPDLGQRPPRSDSVVSLPASRLPAHLVRCRRQFQQGLLNWLRGDSGGLGVMRQAVQAIEDAQAVPTQRAFWWSVGGLFDGVAAELIAANLPTKMAAARIDLQIRRLIEGSGKVADRLRREVLYFLASAPEGDAVAPRLAQVQKLYRLHHLLPPAETIEEADWARIQPVLRDARELLTSAKDAWLKFTSGRKDSLPQLRQALEGLRGKGDALRHVPMQELFSALSYAVESMVARGAKDTSEGMAVEFATALLLGESAIEGFKHLSAEFPQQVEAMAQRLQAAALNLPAPEETTSIALLDDMARRAQERLLLSQVAREIQTNLRQIEQVLDAFFRDHEKRGELAGLSAPIRQVEGALRILGLDRANQLLELCGKEIETLAEPETVIEQGVLEGLAESLSALGFFVEAVEQQRPDADGLIEPMLRRRLGLPEEVAAVDEEAAEETVEHALRDQRSQLGSLMDAIELQPEDSNARAELRQQLVAVKHDAELVADAKLTEATTEALSLLDSETAVPMAKLTEAIKEISVVEQAAPAPAPSAETMRLMEVSDETLDAELLEIYLTEAGEVLQTVDEHLAICRDQPHDTEALRTVRRGFHTLKGSGRMVGLFELGEIAWWIEQRLNRWLEEERPASSTLLDMVALAREQFARWVNDLQAAGRVAPETGALREAIAKVDEELGSNAPPPPAPLPGNRAKAPDAGGAAGPSGAAGSGASGPRAEASEVVIGDQTISATLHKILVDEARQHVHTLGTELEILQFDPALPPSQPMVRAAHTLCGIHRTAGFPLVAELASGLEHGLLALQQEQRGLPRENQPLVAEAINQLRVWVEEIAEKRPLPEAASAEVQKLIEGIGHLSLEAERSPLRLDSEMLAAHQAEDDGPWVTEIEVLPLAEPSLAEVPAPAPEPAAAGAWNERTADEPMEVDPSRRLDEETAPPEEPLPEIEIMAPAAEDLAAPVAVPELEEEPPAGLEEELLPPTLLPVTALFAAPEHTSAPVEPSAPVPDQSAVAPAFEEQVTEPPSAAAAPNTASESPAEPAEPLLDEGDLDLMPVPVLPEAPGDPLAGIRDDVDDQLLPIFLEEAQDLFPRAGEGLRAWRREPANDEHASELRRTLHTFKGSARMAGAMRLGQLAHLMESRLVSGEEVLAGSEELFEALDSDLDQIAFVLERLQRSEFNSPLPKRAVEAEPAEEVALAAAGETLARGYAEPLAVPASAPEPAEAAPPLLPPRVAAVTTAPAHASFEAPEDDEEGGTADAQQRAMLRVRADMIDLLVNESGEISIARARVEGELRVLKNNLLELTNSVIRLRNQVREIEIQAESQIQSTLNIMQDRQDEFDPLEFDRYTRFQEVSRSLTEGVNDVSTIQQALLKNLDDAEAALLAQARLSRDVQQQLFGIRTVPFGSLTERLYRILRQTAKELDKKVNLELGGTQVELDRSVLERLVGPLEHLLRNALDHGIERREVRLASGKPETGEIQLNVAQQGNEVVLTLVDDGAGLDFARIREKAEGLGLIAPGIEVAPTQLIECIFAPGFSTAAAVTQVSGRGIGMDVVRGEITELGGRVEVSTVAGRGTTFTLYLPLTLAVAQAVLVRAGGRLYAIPSPMVAQVQQIKSEPLINLYVTREINWQNNHFPFHYLPRLLGDELHNPDTLRYNPVLLLKSGPQRVAIHVDEMLGNQEVVVKNIGSQLARVTGISGATVLGSGEVVLIINPVLLATRLEAAALASAAGHGPAAAEAETVTKAATVMIVDDSLTVRKITGRLLSREGYETVSAKDGLDALQVLNEVTPDVILLDIEMPRMDGFEFAKTVRAEARTRHLPIIMITSRTAEKHQARARELGIDVYLGKPFQEEELLEHIKRLTS